MFVIDEKNNQVELTDKRSRICLVRLTQFPHEIGMGAVCSATQLGEGRRPKEDLSTGIKSELQSIKTNATATRRCLKR
jgi:hypothetical protein